MKLNKLILALAASVAAAGAQAADIKYVDGVAAVADNEVITQRTLQAALARSKKPAGMSEADHRKEVLAQLINQSLVAQAGKRRNIAASDEEIDKVVAQTAQSRKMSAEKLYATSGLSRDALRRNVADSIIANKVQQQISAENARVSDAEVNAAVADIQAKGQKLPEGEAIRQYRAQHILMKAAPNDPTAETAARQIWQQARSGRNFDQLARQFSQDSSAAQGGDLGWFTDGQMVPEFENAVHTLKPGQVSAPVRSQFGWHIIKLNEVREAGTPEERSRLAVRRAIEQQKSQAATHRLLQDLHKNAYIDIRSQ